MLELLHPGITCLSDDNKTLSSYIKSNHLSYFINLNLFLNGLQCLKLSGKLAFFNLLKFFKRFAQDLSCLQMIFNLEHLLLKNMLVLVYSF